MQDVHPTATAHLPAFITAPGQTDFLLVATTIILLAAVLGVGVLFFWLHSLPERMVHNKVQFDVVAVLALLSLFTHIHAFWVAALLIALIKFPDFSFPNFSAPLNRIAGSLEDAARAQRDGAATPAAQTGSSVPPAVSKDGAGKEGASNA